MSFLQWNTFDQQNSSLHGFPIDVIPIKVEHGLEADGLTPFECYGFRFGNVAYLSDISGISYESLSKLEGVQVLIVDCLNVTGSFVSHFCKDQALNFVAKINPKYAYFTGISHTIEHYSFSEKLESGELNAAGCHTIIRLAFDGLRLYTKK